MGSFNKNTWMRQSRRITTGLLLLANAFTWAESASSAAPISKPIPLSSDGKLPAEAFYKTPAVSNLRLSPDGTHLLALKHVGNQTAVITVNLATNETFYALKTDNVKYKFNWVSWANNNRLLVSIRYADSMHGWSTKFTSTRLMSVDAHKESKMVNMAKLKDDAEFVSQFQDRVMGSVPGDDQHILMGLDDVLWGHQGVYLVDVNTGKRKLVKKEEGTVRSWYTDTAGVVRAGEGYVDSDRKVVIKVLDPRTDKWVRAWEYTVFDDPEISPLGFGKNPNELYLLADHNGTQALYKADLSKDGYPWELIVSNDNYDIQGSLIYSESTHDAVGIYYSDGDESKSIFWNSEFKKFQGGLNKAMPDSSVYITSMSDDGRKYIAFASNAINPGTVYFGNRDTKQLTPIFTSYPELTSDVLSAKDYRTYKARDGLELEGYLSLPKNSNGKNLPTIILPHGGPMSEDGRSFDSFSAFFANRGYAVFQPNFRGSSGRGHDFMMQAVGGMGLAMQDDLEDAVKYLVDQKITDPKRVCIVGASYGGYAALMGTVKTPDLFQCAISFAGISDVKRMRDGAWHYSNKNVIKEQFGNDTDQLKKTSPVRAVEKVKVPILLIHGSDDAVVPVEQSRIMVDELKEKGKTYEYIELEQGSHHLDYLPHRKQTFEAMEAFLKKYLPV